MRQAIAIFENSSEAMIVTDAENIIITVNPAFTRVTGYTSDEIVGQNPDILNAGLQGESSLLAMKTSLELTAIGREKWKAGARTRMSISSGAR